MRPIGLNLDLVSSYRACVDAAKRRHLPAWIREGLEKMERAKQKQLEKERMEAEAEEAAKAAAAAAESRRRARRGSHHCHEQEQVCEWNEAFFFLHYYFTSYL